MSRLKDTTRIATAISKFSQHDLSCQHVTTSNFMEFGVAKFMELVPRQKIDLMHRVWSRLEPMPVPTFGRANINKTYIFVPYRTVFPAWNDFINDTVHTYGDGTSSLVGNTPRISSSLFLNVFTSSSFSTTSSSLNDTNSDFELITNSTTSQFRVFTPLGRRAYKLVRSLGYNFLFNWTESITYFDALPLFSVLKAYLDWFFPSQYAFDSRYTDAEKWLKYDKPDFESAFVSQDLENILMLLSYVNYDTDYFVNAWDNPSAPNDGAASSVSINDIDLDTTDGQVVYDANSDEPVLSAPSNVISQFMLTALRSLSDFMQRNKIVGARALDRYLARYGVVLSSEKLNRSVLVHRASQEIDFGDVTAMADTDGSPLGAYAGKGVSYGQGNVSFSTDEFGAFICIASIMPVVSYYQGLDRTVLHTSRLDFYQPEFDNLGVQALGSNEVYVPMHAGDLYAEDSQFTNQNYKSRVFGFVPRYAEYKVPRDIITGDYILGSKNAGKEAWTLARDLSHEFKNRGAENVVHSYNFVNGSDRQQYDRIFYNVSDNADKFNIIHIFNIKSTFPGSSLWDSYEFKNEDEAQHVNVQTGGSKLN